MIAAMPVFVPPNRGAPAARLGGATRSAGNGEFPNIEVLVPEENLGDVIGDLNSRRANIAEIAERVSLKVVTGTVPIAEMFSYSSKLRGMTAGRGTFSMEPDGYKPVPASVSEQIIKEVEELRKNKS